jgi:hypothetical protein
VKRHQELCENLNKLIVELKNQDIDYKPWLTENAAYLRGEWPTRTGAQSNVEQHDMVNSSNSKRQFRKENSLI